MKKQTVEINGITYTVSSTTQKGVKDGIRMLKKSLKQETKKENDKDV